MLPISAVVYLTNKCFLKCNHCFINDCGKLNTSELSYEILIKTLDDFKKNKVCIIAYTGGDPLLYPKLFDIIEETYKRNMLPLLGISGIGVTNKIAKKIHDLGVGCVQVSLDGSHEDLNAVFRGKNTFNKVVNSIGILQRHDVRTNLAVCISNENFHDFKDMISLCYDMNIYKVKVEFWHDYCDSKKFMMLSEDQKNEIYILCRQIEKEYKLENWIFCPAGNEELTQIHNKALIIDSDGIIRNYENGPDIGNIYDNVPSYFYV